MTLSFNFYAEKNSNNEKIPNNVSLVINDNIKCVVKDADTNETLFGVIISIDNKKIYSDLDGNFSITKNEIIKIKSVKFISYNKYTINFTDDNLIITLKKL